MAWNSLTTRYLVEKSTTDSSLLKTDFYNIENLNAELKNGEAVKVTYVENGTSLIAYKDNATKEIYSIMISNDTDVEVVGYTSEDSLAATVTPANYGDKINYTANGLDDWRIFYNDGAHIFLISTDYVNNNLIDLAKIGATANGNFSIYWNSVPSTLQNMGKNSLFRANLKLSGSHPNARCISALLNNDNWSNFVNGTYAEYAIGGASIEMWMASWNEKYPTEKLYYNPTEYAYCVGTTSYPTGNAICPEELVELQGYKEAEENNMYFPHKAEVDKDRCKSYWLASPANTSVDTSSDEYILNVSCWPYVDNNKYDVQTRGIRPVVSLKSNIKATKNAEGVWILE